SYVFGKNPMYWYRIETSLGRNSLVGTTIETPRICRKKWPHPGRLEFLFIEIWLKFLRSM
ncbi:MAG: hypothetical protein K8S13_20365, partial [Desulfobacula sp.]|uniref:hypothetical protein n=1 Tax=Desulfobacula sp. TaxID=2593537 RepID=UPI0025C18A35